jgi:predicted  nucleic acid-binding Zn-ribbon protein
MNHHETQIEALNARVAALEKQIAELTAARPIVDRRLTNLHRSFMAISGEVIEINEKLKPVLLKAYPVLAPTIGAINRIIRPDPEDDGSRQPPHS